MNHALPLLFAAAGRLDPLQDPLVPTQGPSPFFSGQLRDILLVVGAAIALAILLFLWAYLTRKGRQRNSANTRGTRLIYKAEKGDPKAHGHHHGQRVRKRRREHPDNLPRNPTLAEAGGLPPLRPLEPDPLPPGTPPASPSQAP